MASLIANVGKMLQVKTDDAENTLEELARISHRFEQTRRTPFCNVLATNKIQKQNGSSYDDRV